MSKPTGEQPGGAIKKDLEKAAKKETAAPALRRFRAVVFQSVLLLAIVVFVFLTYQVRATPSFPIDLRITQAIQSIDSPLFTGLMTLISWPGYLPQSIMITLLIALVLYLYGLQWEAVMTLLAALFSGLTNQLVKTWIERPRPSVDLVDVFTVLESYSFPSGHVMFYTILFGFAWYLTYTLFKPSLERSVLLVLFSTFILLVGVSRIYRGQHWTSDVLGAYLLGGVMLAGVLVMYQWGKERFFVRQPVAPSDRTRSDHE